MSEFGQILRQLRHGSGLSIKRLGPELGLTYSYLSKLESGDVRPSEETVQKVAAYFDYDETRLLISAGRIPPDIVKILQDHPEEALGFLRERFGRGRK